MRWFVLKLESAWDYSPLRRAQFVFESRALRILDPYDERERKDAGWPASWTDPVPAASYLIHYMDRPRRADAIERRDVGAARGAAG